MIIFLFRFRLTASSTSSVTKQFPEILKKSKRPASNPTQFLCEHCPFSSKYKHNLKVHQIVHKSFTEVNQIFYCPKCCYKGKLRAGLRLHLKWAHSLSANEINTVVNISKQDQPTLTGKQRNDDHLERPIRFGKTYAVKRRY